MSTNQSALENKRKPLNRKATLGICLLTLLAAAGITAIIFTTEPVAQRESATRESAMLVEVVEVRRGDFRPSLVETGVVRPAREIQISPQIDGRIVKVHPDFVPGGWIEQGEVLVEIELEDYKNILRQRESQLLQAKSDLQLEMGRQEIAKQDFQLFENSIAQGDASLALREPQLAAAKVRVESMQAAVDQAKLDLDRTTLECPFDAQILSRSVNLGSQVSRGEPLARIVGIDSYWVMATVPLSKVPYLQFPRELGGDGSSVTLSNRTSWPSGVTRSGRLIKLAGSLEESTRLARIVIEVEDPLARTAEAEGHPRLLIGEFLEVRIEGKIIEDVARLNRDYLRNNETAWVMDDESKLRIRPLDIVFKDAAHAYVREGLEDGDRVVATHLSTVTDGAALRLEGANEAAEAAETETTVSASP